MESDGSKGNGSVAALRVEAEPDQYASDL